MSQSQSISAFDDVALLQRTSHGDQESLRELYRRYAGVLRSTAYRVLNNATDAEDVLQDVFVQIWDKAKTYDVRRGKPLTWAMTLTRNKAIDRLRRMQRRSRLREDLEHNALADATAVEVDSSDYAQVHETQAIVRSAVMQLSDEQRRAIEMAFFAGLTQNEIAQKLHEPLGTVKARIRRGMIKLRQILARQL